MLATPKSRRGGDELCEHGSDRRETSATRVSDDLQFSIFFEKKGKTLMLKLSIYYVLLSLQIWQKLNAFLVKPFLCNNFTGTIIFLQVLLQEQRRFV